MIVYLVVPAEIMLLKKFYFNILHNIKLGFSLKKKSLIEYHRITEISGFEGTSGSQLV